MKLVLCLLLSLAPLTTLAGADVAATPPTGTPPNANPAVPAASASEASPEAIVQAQLDAYNRRDLEGFLAFYSDDAVLKNHPDEVTQVGKEQMRARYAKRFTNPAIRAEVVQRMVMGRFVVDHERITAPPAKGMLEAVAVYEVKDGKIASVSFLLP